MLYNHNDNIKTRPDWSELQILSSEILWILSLSALRQAYFDLAQYRRGPYKVGELAEPRSG